MNTSRIQIPVGHGRMRAQWLLPDKMNTWQAAVIVIHDIFGFTDDVLSISERLARLGYAVLAPDLYDRPGSKPLCVVKTLKAHQTGRGYSFDQLEACRLWLLEQADVSVTQVGMMGFCMGGHFSMLYAAQAPLTVVAPFYGEVPKQAAALEGICPVVGGWGKRDLIYGGHGERLERHLDKLGVEHDICSYADAGHSYMNNHQSAVFRRLGAKTPLRAAYNTTAAEDSWARVEAFFAATFAADESLTSSPAG